MDPYNPYMRPQQQPPSPSTADPNIYHHQQPSRPPPSQPPHPTQSPWYPNQFHYPSPSPPPPHQNWTPPPPPPSQQPYPPLFPPPYPNQTHHFPPLPPRPYLPPPNIPTSYSPLASQEWGNQNWAPQQGWKYPVASHNNAEDWAARARAWAASKQVAMEDQHQQSSFQQAANPEEQNQYHDQYFRASDTHGQDGQQQQFPVIGYQDFAVSAPPVHQPLVAYPQEPAPFSSGAASYIPDEHLSYPISAGASSASPSVLQLEVPSSYSSVKGRGDQEQLYKSFPLSSSSTQGQLSLRKSPHASSGPVLIDQSMQYQDQEAEFQTLPNDHSLEFGPNFASQDFVSAPVTSLPSVSSWMPGIPSGSIHPPIPPVPPTGPQLDPCIVLPSSVSGNAATQLGSFPPASSFLPTAPSAASYGLATGLGFHPTSGFPGDTFGFSNGADRPKKASVPNWLKEEIIKNASVITRPSMDHAKEETQSIEDEGVEKSFGKDQADRKSIDSSRLTEEDEDDDEDVEDAARTAIINQEIKRILTEVLLKVTDELFDEIATKVLDEDDPTLEVAVENISGLTNKKMSASPPVLNKAAAKILVPLKGNKTEIEEASENVSSDAPGNILGLAYATDEDDDNENEIHSSSVSVHTQVSGQQLSNSKISEVVHVVPENGSTTSELGMSRPLTKPSAAVSEHSSSKMVTGARDAEISVNGGKDFNSSNESEVDVGGRENLSKNLDATVKKSMIDNSQSRATKMRSKLVNRPESEGKYAAKSSMKELEIARADVSEHNYRRQQDEKRRSRSEKTGDRNSLQERELEKQDVTTWRKLEDCDSKKRTSEADVKDNRKEEKLQRAGLREDDNEKGIRLRDKQDKHSGEGSRRQRRHSPSLSRSSKGRNSKDNDSSDEASIDVKRKSISRKRYSSPSGDRSRRRHVSRSPHSKRSQRRNSPYSSLETTRLWRLRSKSPGRRRR